MNKKLSTFVSILYFGAIWGILEASVGYVLHLLPVLIAGTIMFPIGAVILFRAHQVTQSKKALIGVGAVAAAIKAINLFMPLPTIWKAINPMLSIVFESLLVLAVIGLLAKDNHVAKVAALPIASVGWRVGFLFALYVESWFTHTMSSQITSLSAMASFALYSGLISGLMATALFYIVDFLGKRVKGTFAKKPIISFGLFAIAIVLTVLL